MNRYANIVSTGCYLPEIEAPNSVRGTGCVDFRCGTAVLYRRAWSEMAACLEKQVAVERWVALEGVPLEGVIDFTVVRCGPEDLWCLLYSSGTMGRPKGVMLSHRMIIWNGWGSGRVPHAVVRDRWNRSAARTFALSEV